MNEFKDFYLQNKVKNKIKNPEIAKFLNLQMNISSF